MNTPLPLNVPLPFFGVDNHRFKLGDTVYEAVEDPDDGYRSYLGAVVAKDGGIFFPNHVAVTILHESTDSPTSGETFKGYVLRDSAGHTWLRFGTQNADDYYPWFVFEYTPPLEATP